MACGFMHIVHLFEKHLNHCKRCKPAEALPVLARFRMSTTVQAESKRTCSFCRGAARSRTLSRAKIQKIQQTPSINDIKNVVKFGFAPFLPQNTCCKGTTNTRRSGRFSKRSQSMSMGIQRHSKSRGNTSQLVSYNQDIPARNPGSVAFPHYELAG